MIIKSNLETIVPYIVMKYFIYNSSLSLPDDKEKDRESSELKLKDPCLVLSVQIN